MDILKTGTRGSRIILLLGGLLVVALVLVAIQREPVGQEAKEVAHSPVDPPPSKENVGKVVQERLAHLKEVVRKNPSDAKAAIELARTLQDGHDTSNAIIYYELGLKHDPKNIGARVDYSLCLYQIGRREEAFVQNLRVLKYDPSNAQALYNLGAIYGNAGRSDSASYYWNKLISLHPSGELSHQARQNLAQLSRQGM
jgi:tetratricopeptide (TPR) repeat protein